jgi:Glycosyltransferase
VNHEGRNRIYLNVGHTGLNSAGITRWLNEARVRPVYFLHDLIPITHPQFCRPGERDNHVARIKTMLVSGTGIIGNSEATLAELSKFARAEKLQQPPAIAALLGSDSLGRDSRNNATIEGNSDFVVLGTIEARKNHLMLLRVWRRLIELLGPDAPRLLIIGQRGWECDEVFELLDRHDLFAGRVIELSKCDDRTLDLYLAGARALLFPSLVEGYGLPLAEALAAGTPVIASDLPAFHEIGGRIPDYLDPLDESGWQRAILEYARRPSERRQLQVDRMANFHPPTWNDHFAVVDLWLNAL